MLALTVTIAALLAVVVALLAVPVVLAVDAERDSGEWPDRSRSTPPRNCHAARRGLNFWPPFHP